MRILALDIASRLGWATDGADGRLIFGVYALPTSAENPGVAFCAFERWLDQRIIEHRPDTLAIEAPLVLAGRRGAKVLTNARTVAVLNGLWAIALLVSTSHKLRIFQANVMSIKKHFTGNGHADKAAMVKQCRLLGWPVTDHNAADALGLLDFARHTLRQPNLAAGPLYTRAA